MDQSCHVTTCDRIRTRLIYLNDELCLPFREIAKTAEFRPIPPGTLCAIAKHGKVPEKWYARLSLPPEATVVVMGGGDVPPGTQVLGACYCSDCNAGYVSNHPRRKKCFTCSPIQKGKVEAH
jgi:hypothetical protein